MSQCYWANGNAIAASAHFLPCNTTGHQNSACCLSTDECTTTGLCVKQGGVGYYIGGCTDESWTDTRCPRFCTGTDYAGSTTLANCSSDGGVAANPWCCEAPGSTSSCCNNSFVVSNGAWGTIFQVPDENTTSTSASVSGQSAGTTSTGVSTVTVTVTAHSSLANTLGLAIGIPLGILVAALIVFGVWLMWRRKRREPTPQKLGSNSNVGDAYIVNEYEREKQAEETRRKEDGHELPIDSQIYELHGKQNGARHELQGGSHLSR